MLNRVQAAGGCAAQLDLLLLLTADEVTMLDAGPSAGGGAVGGQERRAEAACPHDPTPGWLVGEAQLRMLEVSETVTDADPTVIGALRGAHATFSQLAAEYPRDPGVLTGLGDSYLRAGTYLMSSEPFTAQLDFRSAIAAYDRASALGDARDAAAGVARAPDRPRPADRGSAAAGASRPLKQRTGRAPRAAHRSRRGEPTISLPP